MILTQGSSGPDVEQLQLRLKAAGYDCGDVDGDYGPRTTAAVRAFQASRPGLAVDGAAGPATRAALDAVLAPIAPVVPTAAFAASPRAVLRRGDRGADVEQIQLRLRAAGYDPGPADGDYGARTAAAVLAFQADRPDLEDDGVAGPMTVGALDAAIAKKQPDVAAKAPSAVPCESATWAAFQRLVASVTGQPVRYGPGRGLWHDGKFLVTYGAGRIGGTIREWPNAIGRSYPSFHCSSWTNFVLGWLLRRNQNYTHAGNVPSLFDLLEKSADLHQIPGGGAYRGYGDACSRIEPDGSGAKRSGCPDPKVVDARELYDRRASLPTFVTCGQSTRRSDGSWKWWHHTVLFVVDHRDRDRLYRIAADGYKGAQGYSADPMRWAEITDKNVGNYAAAVYRAYGVDTTDGTYGDLTRPIADVDFEVP